MAILLGRLSDRPSTNKYEYYVDTLEDIQNLPTRKNGVLIKSNLKELESHLPAMGSLCLVICTSQVFCLSSDGWRELDTDTYLVKNDDELNENSNFLSSNKISVTPNTTNTNIKINFGTYERID